MQNTTISALALSLSLVLPAIAGAQTPPTQTPPAQTPTTQTPTTQTPPAQQPPPPDTQKPPKAAGTPTFFVSANVGYQIGTHDYGTSTQFPIYDEIGTLQSTGQVKSGLVVDASVAYKFTPTFGASVGFSTFNSKSDAAVLAQIPHPIFFDQIRTASYTASGLKTSAPAVHLDAVWFIPFTTSLDFTVSAGPSIVFAKQDVVTVANLAPEAPPFTSPQINSVTVSSESKTGVGFNVGADAIYAVGPQLGIGVTLRYLYAKPSISGLSDKVNVGGFQVLGGIRYKF